MRVAVTGLLSAQYKDILAATSPEIRLEDPEAALQRLQPDLSRSGDVRVLLYHGPKAEADELARRFPLFQLVVFAHEGDHPVDAEHSGSLWSASAGQDGKYLGIARTTSGAPQKLEQVTYSELGPSLSDDAEIAGIKSAYLDRVATEDLLSKVGKSATANGDSFAGSAACKSCHASAYATWSTSAHSHATETLAVEKEDRDPECVPCHVVGLDRVGGFVSRQKTPHLQEVGCESCHGPAARHVADPKVHLGKAGPTACQQCHVSQHSPRFDFAAYWPKIKH